MKCDCKNCHGRGLIEIECPDCHGGGDVNVPIERMKLDQSDPRYPVLLEIQKDANTILRQAELMSNLKPHRADSYSRQARACLAILDHEAGAVKA